MSLLAESSQASVASTSVALLAGVDSHEGCRVAPTGV